MKATEKKIAERIQEFDLICLLQLLQHLGYPPEDIHFNSHFSNSSQPSLLHKIQFHPEPAPQVLITLNLGLLSAQSPLPSYFFKKLDQGRFDAGAFANFIGYFDHFLLRAYLYAIYPEMNKKFFPQVEMTKRRFVHLLDLRSCCTLHWLFQLVFPELGVQASKVELQRQMHTMPIVLGKTVLGNDAIFGAKTSIPISGSRVTLFSEFDTTGSGEPWPREIKQRLASQIFPLLRSLGMDIEIILVIRAQKTWAKLHTESYLGYDKIRGGSEQHRRVRIFRGRMAD